MFMLHLPKEIRGETGMAEKPKAATKSVIFQKLADATNLERKDVALFFDELSKLIKTEVGKKGPGIFNLPGLLKIKRVEKPPTKAREGINPFNGEKMMFKAKAASKKVRIAALKTLKEFVN